MAEKTTGKLKLWLAKITDKISDTINTYLPENFTKIDMEFSSLKDDIDEINSKLSVFSFLRTSKNFTPNDTMEIPVLKGRTAYLVLISQGGVVTQAYGAYIVYPTYESYPGIVLPLKDSSYFSVQYIPGSGTIFIKNTYSANLEIAISVIRIL